MTFNTVRRLIFKIKNLCLLREDRGLGLQKLFQQQNFLALAKFPRAKCADIDAITHLVA